MRSFLNASWQGLYWISCLVGVVYCFLFYQSELHLELTILGALTLLLVFIGLSINGTDAYRRNLGSIYIYDRVEKRAKEAIAHLQRFERPKRVVVEKEDGEISSSSVDCIDIYSTALEIKDATFYSINEVFLFDMEEDEDFDSNFIDLYENGQAVGLRCFCQNDVVVDIYFR